MSRQTEWQKKKRDAGLCTRCGREPLVNKNYGEKCRAKCRASYTPKKKKKR